ncbi:nucleotide-diphospho-sugar transferase [Mycena vulgaris]|nr:nucleotide-diphospho-sugar transferase [Mycena vulgaris]
MSAPPGPFTDVGNPSGAIPCDPGLPAVKPWTEPAGIFLRPWYSRFGRRKIVGLRRPDVIAVAADAPALVLPSPPTAEEKYIYVQTRRAPLYLFALFAFLSSAAGTWYFVVIMPELYWFGVFATFMQLYSILSYSIEYLGRDYELDNHKKVVEKFTSLPGHEPSVDIFLPCCREPLEILENTYKYVAQLAYPNYKVWVLDDGGLDTVKHLAERFGFNYVRRSDKPHLRKAGNLRHAFRITSGEFFVVFDADFCPRADFIEELVPLMRKEREVAIIQTPQFFRSYEEQTWVEQGGGATEEIFFRVVQVNRDRWGAAACVGSNALYRREALKEIGGAAEISHSEDLHTGFQMLKRGWCIKYVPLALACGTCPDTAKAYFAQQMRWCSSSTTLVYTREFWKSDLRIMQKMCFLTGLLYYNADAMTIFMSPIPGGVLIWKPPEILRYYLWAFMLPSVLHFAIVLPLWSRQRYNINVPFIRALQQYAHLMALKDNLFGTLAVWVPSGDATIKNSSSANNKYRNMRILSFIWVYGTTGVILAGAGLQIARGFHWYNFLPALLFQAYIVLRTSRFTFST